MSDALRLAVVPHGRIGLHAHEVPLDLVEAVSDAPSALALSTAGQQLWANLNTLPQAVDVLGVNINPVTHRQLIQVLVDWAHGRHQRRAYHANAHALNLARDDPAFRDSLNEADLVYCDGYGAKWAASMLGPPLPARLTPPDWIDAFLAYLDPDVGVYLLGDRREVVSKCAGLMSEKHSDLRVVGAQHGFFDVTGEANEQIVGQIRDTNATVLIVGMGMPRQEVWIDANLEATEAKLAVSVGALFQYYVGAKRRAPGWMTNHGLEWLGRLAVEPRYTYQRYLRGNPQLVYNVLKERFER